MLWPPIYKSRPAAQLPPQREADSGFLNLDLEGSLPGLSLLAALPQTPHSQVGCSGTNARALLQAHRLL